jgi:hypothetical protein
MNTTSHISNEHVAIHWMYVLVNNIKTPLLRSAGPNLRRVAHFTF